MVGPTTDAINQLRGDVSETNSRPDSYVSIGTVETFHPVGGDTDTAAPMADVRDRITGGLHTHCEIDVNAPGYVAGLPEGTDVVVKRDDVRGMVVSSVRYTEETPAPQVAANQTRIRRGEMAFEFDTDPQGRGVIRTGHQPTDGEDHDAAYLARSDSSIEHYAGTVGACYHADGSYYRSGMGSYLAGTGTPGTASPTGGTTAPNVEGGFPAPTDGQPTPDALSPQDWRPVFEDTFGDAGTATIEDAAIDTQAVSGLDTRKWSVGFGWGTETDTSAESISENNIRIENGNLVLGASHDSGSNITAGAINTRNKAAYGPGHYWEARIQMPNREGFLPAFWSKPDSETWPPEIDFVEILGDIDTSAHHVHYVRGGGDPGGPHEDWCNGCNNDTNGGIDFSAGFHVFGCAWERDRIRFFVDNEKVHEVTNDAVLESVRKGAPFYTMLNIHIDKAGTTDKTVTWPEEMVVDYCRVFENISTAGVDRSGQF